MKSVVLTLTLAALTLTATESFAGSWDRVTVKAFDAKAIHGKLQPMMMLTKVYLPHCHIDEMYRINGKPNKGYPGNDSGRLVRYKYSLTGAPGPESYVVRRIFLSKNDQQSVIPAADDTHSFELDGLCKGKAGRSEDSCICPIKPTEVKFEPDGTKQTSF